MAPVDKMQNMKKRSSCNSLDCSHTSFSNSEAIDEDFVLRVRQLSTTELDREEGDEADDQIADLPTLLAPMSLRELRELDGDYSWSEADSEDAIDLEMPRKREGFRRSGREEQEEGPQPCLSVKTVSFALIGTAVVFGAIFTIVRMRSNHYALFD